MRSRRVKNSRPARPPAGAAPWRRLDPLRTHHTPGMSPRTLLAVAAVALAANCSIYDQELVTRGMTGAAGGGSTAGEGGASGSGGSGSSAGSAGQGDSPGAAPASGGGGTSGANGGAAGLEQEGGAGGSVDVEPFELVDDMEDGDRFVVAGSGRDGAWQSHNDATLGSIQEPPPGATFTMTELAPLDAAREGSLYAAGLHLSGFEGPGWGALMVVTMRATGLSVDASAFCGLHFWAKRGEESAPLVLRVVDIHSSPLGGLCVDEQSVADQCNDDFHASVPVGTEWKDYMVRFSDLNQWGFGYASPTGKLDAAHLHAVAFSIDEVADYRLLIDDLAFVREGYCD
jgi:hypothetical protein